MIIRILSGCGVALVLGMYAERVQAGQVFLCEDGKSVQIATADLEEAKRFDPCVARYFGGVVSANAVPLPVRRPDRAGVRSDIAAVASALRKRTETPRSVSTVPPTTAAAPADRATAPQVGTAETSGTSASITPMKPSQKPKLSEIQRQLAALGSGDYRKVRIINAGSGQSWFRHER